MRIKNFVVILFVILFAACTQVPDQREGLPLLQVSENQHFLVNDNGEPFLWLGDTGWLLLKKLSREDAELYLDNRKDNGFNVIQVMLCNDLNSCVNFYGDSSYIHKNIGRPLETDGASADVAEEYDFWDHLDYIVDLANEKGLYMALVPLWGGNVKNSLVTPQRGAEYGLWLAERYKDKSNIIWLNGGDTFGSDSTEFWNILGETLDQNDPNHLVTFHPRGRTQSSTWFHHADWLDFNMVQSGHRRYDQDDTKLNYGEDNWRYIQVDYNLSPARPTIDAEPSYEGIPQGLHDTTQAVWNDDDVRRYAYWSVLAGGFGFTYGHNSVMQFFMPGDNAAYGAKIDWKTALDAPGAQQMIHLKKLIQSRPQLDLVPDQTMVETKQGERYEFLIASRGIDYAYVYTYTGRNMEISMGKIAGEKVKASWYDPRNGTIEEIGVYENKGSVTFDPPGEHIDGNDWILVLDTKK